MVRMGKTGKELFSYLDLAKLGERLPAADAIAMSVEFIKVQGEIAYEVGKRQAIAVSSSASTIGIGWSAFFFGIMQESWLSSSIGLMLVFAGTFILAYWMPKVLDKVKYVLDESGASKFYQKWLSENEKSGALGEDNIQ